MKRNISLVAVALIIVLSSGMILALGGCEKEEPWWKDWENIQIVFEDERMEEQTFTCGVPHEERIMFHYTYHSEDTEEYIPRVRVLYRGVEQEFYLKILGRERFDLYPDGYDFDHPYPSVIINDIGGYRVHLQCWLNEEDGSSLNNFIAGTYIYIIVSAEEKAE